MLDKAVSNYLAKLGRKGGSSRSKAKLKAVTFNLRKAWVARRKSKAVAS